MNMTFDSHIIVFWVGLVIGIPYGICKPQRLRDVRGKPLFLLVDLENVVNMYND